MFWVFMSSYKGIETKYIYLGRSDIYFSILNFLFNSIYIDGWKKQTISLWLLRIVIENEKIKTNYTKRVVI